MADPKKLKPKQAITALVKVSHQVYLAAPTAVILKVVSALIDAVIPIITAYFAAQATTALADAYTGKPGAGDTAVFYVILAAGMGLFTLVWGSAVRYMSEVARVKIVDRLVETLMDQFTHLEFWRYEDKETADTYDKADSFTYYAANIFDDITQIFTSSAQLIISLVALVFVQWWFGVILLVAVAPSAVIQWKISRMQTRFWHGNVSKRRTANDICWSVFQPATLGETRMYGVVGYLLKMYRELRNIDNTARLKVERRYIFGRITASVIEAAGQLAIELITVFKIIGHAWPIGQYIFVQQLVSRAVGSVSSLSSTFNGIDDQLAALYEYEKFMALPRVSKTGNVLKDFPHELHIDNVSFTYPFSKQQVLNNVSFTIKSKQHIAIVGENGAGKSTLIKLISGLFVPSKGEIMLDNVNLHSYTEDSWHKHISVLHQDFLKYWFTTPLDNVWYGDVSKPLDKKRYSEALKKAGATGFINKLPKGKDTILNKWNNHDDDTPGVEISGGQWQRLALARNFYRDTELVILDEPTSAIDALAEAKIFDYLFKETDKTIITISHRLSTVKKADIIFMLKDGQLVEQGTYEDLVKKRGEFYKMFESQID